MSDLSERQRAMARLLGMTNQQINEINLNTSNRYGVSDGEKLAVDGISRNEFLDAVRNVDKFSSTSFNVTRPPMAPGEAMPPIGLPNGGVSNDSLMVLQSIDATLRGIFELLLNLTGSGTPAPAEPPSDNPGFVTHPIPDK